MMNKLYSISHFINQSASQSADNRENIYRVPLKLLKNRKASKLTWLCPKMGFRVINLQNNNKKKVSQ